MRLRTIALLTGAIVAAGVVGATPFKLRAVVHARIDVEDVGLEPRTNQLPSKLREILNVPFVEKDRVG